MHICCNWLINTMQCIYIQEHIHITFYENQWQSIAEIWYMYMSSVYVRNATCVYYTRMHIWIKDIYQIFDYNICVNMKRIVVEHLSQIKRSKMNQDSQVYRKGNDKQNITITNIYSHKNPAANFTNSSNWNILLITLYTYHKINCEHNLKYEVFNKWRISYKTVSKVTEGKQYQLNQSKWETKQL